MPISFFTLEFLVIGFLNKIPSSLYWICMVNSFPWFMILLSTQTFFTLFHSYFVHFVLLTRSLKESIIFVFIWVCARKRERHRETETGNITMCVLVWRSILTWSTFSFPTPCFLRLGSSLCQELTICFNLTAVELPASAPMLSSSGCWGL